MQPDAGRWTGDSRGHEPERIGSSGAAGDERLRALVDRSRALTGLLDPDGTVVYLSAEAVRVFTGRRELDEYRGFEPQRRIHPDDFELLAGAFGRAVESPGDTVPFRARTLHDDGEYRTIEGDFTSYVDDPEVRGIVLSVFDVTERTHAENELRERLEVEQVLSAISRGFVDRAAEDVDGCIDHALAEIGELTGADRAYVFRMDGESTTMSNTHEWVHDTCRSVQAELQDVPFAARPHTTRTLLELKPVVVSTTGDIPEDVASERDVLERLDTRSYVNWPMVEHGRAVGFVGIDACRAERDWSAATLTALDQLATLVTTALGRHRSELARRRSEDARRQTEDRFRRLVQSSPDLVLVIDGAGIIKYASPVGEAMLGYKPEDKVGTIAWELIHPDDLEGALAALSDVVTGNLRGRDPERLRVLHNNGYWVPVEVTATNLLDDPVLGGVVVNVRDMRERDRIEATLREAEVRFQQAWQHAPIGMGLAGPDGQLLRVNPAFCDMLGYSEEEMLGYHALDITHPDDAARSGELHDELFAGERRTYTIEKRYRRRDGSFMWARVSVSIVRDDEGTALYSIGQIEDIAERRRLQEQLAYEASHDALTGLPQRKRLLEDLERALAGAQRRGTGVAVLFIDVDHFKRVNDAFGHSAGDELLVEVGRRLRACVRGVDTAARFGGDEFVVVCPDLVNAADAARIAERIKDHLGRPFSVRGGEVIVGASIGIALAEAGVDASTLLGRADTAAYRAKERGRNRWEIFDDELRESVTRRLDTELALRRALEHEELRLLYQPIVVLASGEVRGFEALVRWERPERGLVAPAEFLSVAEETGLIVPLDRYVLSTACRELARWNSLVPDRGTPLLSVNLSGRQLLQPELLDDVRELLAEIGVEPERLCLELGESVLVHDPYRSLDVLAGLRDLGVRVAIDDFGAGYSSLSHLRRVPLAHVKIDRSLVLELGTNPTSALIAGSVIDLARTLGMPAVAVGVETPEHVAALQGLGCELAQGYFFSPPVPADRVPGILAGGTLPPTRADD